MIDRHIDTASGWASAVTLASMIATPLCRRGGPARRGLAWAVVGGLATVTGLRSARRWGPQATATAAAGIGAATFAVEWLGSTTGFPFGRYGYSAALRPQAAGVPLIVPAAWFAMAVPAREAAHAALGARSTPARRIAAGAVALTAWDLFLDPQMTGEGYWAWQRRGRYRGIPLTNFAGWLLVAAAVMAGLERALPPGDEADPALVAEYAVVATMETVGFARFFRDRLVAVVGGGAMGPIAVAAVGSLVTTRRRHGRRR